MKLKYQLRGLGIGIIVTAILMGVATSHGIPLTDAEIRARALELGMVESGSLKLTDVGGAAMLSSQPDGDSGADNPGGEAGGVQPDGSEAAGGEQESEGAGEAGRRQESDGFGEAEGEQESGGSGAAEGEQESGGSGAAEGEQESGGSGAAEGEQESGGSGAAEGEQNFGGSGAAEPGQEVSGAESDPNSDGQGSYAVRDGDTVTVVIAPGTHSYEVSEVLAETELVEDAGAFDEYLCNNLYSRKIVDGTYEIHMGASEEEIAKIITRDR